MYVYLISQYNTEYIFLGFLDMEHMTTTVWT